MCGWLSRASARASRLNRSANAGVVGRFRPEDLQRHEPVEPRLPRLVDGAHAAVAQQLQDFELRKMPRQLCGGGGTKRDEPGSGVVGASSERSPPIDVLPAMPADSKHRGQIPAGASAANSAPHCGHRLASVIEGLSDPQWGG